MIAQTCPDCGRDQCGANSPSAPVESLYWERIECFRAQVAARDAEIARLRADLEDAKAHWRAAEVYAEAECGARACGEVSKITWSRRAKGYRCAACEEAGR